MAENSAIEWTDSTFNPWIGCAKVSPACDHCYAARQDAFRKWTPEGWGGPRRRTSVALWKGPVKWNAQPFAECTTCLWRGEVREAAAQDAPGETVHLCPVCDKQSLREARRRVFCASLADWLDNEVPIEWLVDLLDLVRRTPELDYLLLSKRIGNWRKRLAEAMSHSAWADESASFSAWLEAWLRGTPPANVWLGATVVTQEEADRDIPKLLAVPARVRFLSIEPMLGEINLKPFVGGTEDEHDGEGGPHCVRCGCFYDGDHECPEGFGPRLDWVICGGESGPGARPMHPDWARSLRDQCAAAGVPFLFKQHGEWREPQEGEAFSTAMGRAQKVPAFIVAPTGTVHCFENDQTRTGGKAVLRVGKKAAGRLLDGVEHNGFPT